MRNRLLKKALTRERRNTEERHQRQRRQMETREALSIIAAASSANELSTFLHDEHGTKVLLTYKLEIKISRFTSWPFDTNQRNQPLVLFFFCLDLYLLLRFEIELCKGKSI